MQLSLLKTKIHRATVTHAELNYEGSIAIDGLLLEGSGIISLNGGAARHVQIGDLIIIAAFAGMSEEEAERFQPKLIYVDGSNKITHTNHSIPKQAA
jgi:aspartate 1-decarboxylase